MKDKLSLNLQKRVQLILVGSFLITALFTAMVLIYFARAYHHQITQIMHKDLANYVVSHYNLMKEKEVDVEAVEHLFHDLMIFGPNFEFYLLSTEGKILGYSADPSKIVRKSVDTDIIQSYLADDNPTTKLWYGDDPRGEARQKVFSTAAIEQDGKTLGYLYVILGGEIYDDIAGLLFENKVVHWGMIVSLVGLSVGLMVTILLALWVFRPLRKLMGQVERLQGTGFEKKHLENSGYIIEEFSGWQENSVNEVEMLGSTVRAMLEKLGDQYRERVTIDELRKELLSHVSHDLRTPLSAVIGYIETWELNHDKVSPEEGQRYIATAKRNAKQVGRLIEQLFELAHLDSDSVQVSFERFSLTELVFDVVQKFEVLAKSKQVDIKIMPDDRGVFIKGDIEKLDRVFTNLIENAIRHTPEGGKILIKLSETGQRITCEVTDTGIGIPKSDLPHIFDAHYKAGNSVRDNSAHGGLGLAITKRLLELHDSGINVKSSMNIGTQFKFSLMAA